MSPSPASAVGGVSQPGPPSLPAVLGLLYPMLSHEHRDPPRLRDVHFKTVPGTL